MIEPPRTPSERGVTLIELVIATAVLAVLCTLAVSSYRQHVLRAQRTEAKTELLRVHARQERFYGRNGYRYADDLTQLGYAVANDAPTAGGRYLISIDAGADGAAFTARAKAAPAMAPDEECREFWIDQLGQRAAAPDPLGRCW